MIDPNTTVIEFPDTFAGTVPIGFFKPFTKIKTIFWGKNMGFIEPGVIPDEEIVLVLPLGYQYVIDRNVSEKVAIAIHQTDVLRRCIIDIPSRHAFFLWCDTCSRFQLHQPMNIVEAEEGFQDLAYNPRNGWVIAVHRTNDKLSFEGTRAIDQFSDYWKKEEIKLVTSEVILTKEDIIDLFKQSEEARVIKIDNTVRELTNTILADVKKAVVDGSFDKLWGTDHISSHNQVAVHERLVQCLPGLTITRNGNLITARYPQ